MTLRLAPSVLAADFGDIGREVAAAEAAGADAIHVDVMDGHFVPEISFGRRMVETLKRHTSLPLDVHLMVANPERHVLPFVESGAEAVTVHLEAFAAPAAAGDVLARIREAGALPGVALKPATPAEAVDELWDRVRRVLVMTVEPGYSGQAFMPEMLPKIAALAERARARTAARSAGQPAAAGGGVEIAVDGGIDERTIGRCLAAGATFCVAGSSVYSSRRSVAEGLAALRRAGVHPDGG